MIAILDLGAGNLGSVRNMLRRIGASCCITEDPRDLAAAEKIILPGVGSFDCGMRSLKARGLVESLTKRALEDRVPILAICLGMQLITNGSEEGGVTGLKWLSGYARRLALEGSNVSVKVPHMGWNTIRLEKACPLFYGLEENARFYFLHSYHVVCDEPGDVLTTTTYGIDFASSLWRGNILAVQFHPEKSHRFGMRLLNNFVEHF